MMKMLLSILFCGRQVIIIKISQTTRQKVGYFNSSQIFPDNKSDIAISLKKIKTNL